MSAWLRIGAFLLTVARSSICHVLLTFPEARYPPFDFLDSQRTLGPCGVPKSARSQLTHFQTGRPYKLGWKVALERQGQVRFSLLDQRGNLVADGVQKANGSSSPRDRNAHSAEMLFPVECPNCTLLLEKEATELGTAAFERSCAEVDIRPPGQLTASEQCSGNGQWQASAGHNGQQDGGCQCGHGFSGEYCQQRDDCQTDADCGPDGKCVQDGISQGQRSCFCQFGFFGTNCERRSDPDPADQGCFRHNGPSASSATGDDFSYGLFNRTCYQQKELPGSDDRLYWRLLGNQLEILLDFRTNSWLALGWRPLNIPPSCRLFPQIRSTETELAKSSGFAREWLLESPLHPMDCTDLVMGSVLEGRLHIADMYSRDRSSPLRDSWLDGEESLSAAYGLRSGDRTVLMFRRLVPEIEPTDHPLGPGPLFVIFAKGGSDSHQQQWKYHGNGTESRGHFQLEFVSPSQVHKIRGPLVHLDQSSAESKGTTTTTTTVSSTTRRATTMTMARPLLTGTGKIWLQPKEAATTSNEEVDDSTTTTATARQTSAVLAGSAGSLAEEEEVNNAVEQSHRHKEGGGGEEADEQQRISQWEEQQTEVEGSHNRGMEQDWPVAGADDEAASSSSSRAALPHHRESIIGRLCQLVLAIGLLMASLH